MSYRLERFAKVSSCRAVAQAAHRASLQIMESYDCRFNMDRWDQPVIAAFDGRGVIGFIQFNRADESRIVEISLAWVDPKHPKALALMLLTLRKMARESGATEVNFCHHAGNAQMARLAKISGAQLRSMDYRLELSADDITPPSNPPNPA